MAKQELRDLIVVIPGIMGSVLEKNGVELWGPTLGSIRRALFTDALVEYLSLRASGSDEGDLRDRVQATHLVSLPRVLAGLVKTDGYDALRRMIAESFKVIPAGTAGPAANYFEFPYDWRRDNRHTAARLKDVVDRGLREWRAFSGITSAKAILITHSMGGLVGRYYAEVLEGWRDCRALITLGTPHRGAGKAVGFLSNGPSWPLKWLVDIAQSFPSIYQLLPLYEMLDVGGELRRVAETPGLPGIDEPMALSALRFHREIEEAARGNRQEGTYIAQFKTIPFVGTTQPTIQSTSLVSGRLVASEELPRGIDLLFAGGDGTVPRLSATPIELSGDAREYFLPECHGMLQRNPHLLDSLRELLVHLQARGLGAIRGPSIISGDQRSAALSLRVQDVYPEDEPVVVRAEVLGEDSHRWAVEGVVASVEQPGLTWQGTFADSGDGQTWVVGSLPEGVYRVEVRPAGGGQGAPTAVHDVFEVTARRNLDV